MISKFEKAYMRIISEMNMVDPVDTNIKTQAYTLILNNETFFTNNLLTGTRHTEPITSYD